MFTNREIAIMIWVNIFLIYCISNEVIELLKNSPKVEYLIIST